MIIGVITAFIIATNAKDKRLIFDFVLNCYSFIDNSNDIQEKRKMIIVKITTIGTITLIIIIIITIASLSTKL